MRLLIVEDNDALRKILARRLTEAGYVVDACADGTDGWDYASSVEYDGMILDIMLPGMNGLELLSRLREAHKECGVLMLTAKDGISDRVKGLDMGADDYLVKPFAFEELLARVRALLRKRPESRSTILSLDDLRMDVVSHTVTRGGREIMLTTKEYALLEYLLRNRGQVLTRDQIHDHVWHFESGLDSNVVDVYVRYLRQKIDKDAPVKLLHTMRGVGYVLKIEENVP